MRRISTFTPWVAADVFSGHEPGASWDGSTITTAQLYKTSGTTLDLVTRTFDEDGTPLSTVTQTITVASINFYFQSTDPRLFYLSGASWYVDGTTAYTPITTPYVDPGGVNATCMSQPTVTGTYPNQKIYTIGGSGTTMADVSWIARYDFTSGVPGLTPEAGNNVLGYNGASGSFPPQVFGGDDGYIYVYSDHNAGWWKFDEDLNLIWGAVSGPGVVTGPALTESGEKHCVICNNTLITARKTDPSDVIAIKQFQITADAVPWAQIGGLASTLSGPVLPLGDGLAITSDGVFTTCTQDRRLLFTSL